MPYRIHVLPQRCLTDHRVRVTMQEYDEPLHHDVVLNARRTKLVKAVTRRREPIRIARGFEVRRDGEVIGVLLEPYDRLPHFRHKTWLAISVEGPQPCCNVDLHCTAAELYWATWRAELTAIETRQRKAQREVLPEEKAARRRADRIDSEALAGLVSPF